MLDQAPLLGGVGGCLQTSQHLLVQAILTLDDAHNSHSQTTKSSSTQTQIADPDSSLFQNIKTALERLSQLYVLLFGSQNNQGPHSFTQWISDNRKLLTSLLGDASKSNNGQLFEIGLGDEPSGGNGVIEVIKGADGDSSPPQPCDTLQSYQPLLGFNDELNQFRKLVERKFAATSDGIPRGLVEQIAALELLFHITRDQTTDPIWNVSHQVYRKEVFVASDVGKVFRQKCACPAAVEGKQVDHSQDPHCPRNVKEEDSKLFSHPGQDDANECVAPVPGGQVEEQKPEAKPEEEKKEEEKPDPTEKIHSKELMAEILDMIGPQHVKDHFQKIKGIVSSSYKETNPWEGKYFGAVLMGPASTG